MAKRIIAVFVTVLMLSATLLPVMASADEKAVIYVSPNGNDSAVGTIDAPLKTLEGAKQRVRELKAKGMTVSEVIFRGGDYRVDNVVFDSVDSGTEETPIVYRAYEGETPRFKGSVELDVSGAQPVTDEFIRSRLYDDVRDKIVVIDLASQGISQGNITDTSDVATAFSFANETDYNSVFVDEEEQPIAQWPNGREYTAWTKTLNQLTIVYSEANPGRWIHAKDWWVAAFPAWDFSMSRVTPVKLDPQTKSIEMSSRAPYKYTSGVSKRWKAFNLLEEIDLPGEFHIDRYNMKLYMYPAYTMADSKIELSVATNLVTMNNVSHVTFRGLEFSQCRGIGVKLCEVVNVDFENCHFKSIASKAINSYSTKKPITGAGYWQKSYMFNDASYNSDIRGCIFEMIGGTALYLCGGNADTLKASGNIIEDNIVTTCNQRYIPDGAVLLTGVGNTFRNNHIGKSAQHAVFLFGNDHIVENNEIYDVLREVSDAGAIYQGRNQIQRGSVVRRNFIHNLWPTDTRLRAHGVRALYVDDCQQGITFENNILVNMEGAYNDHGSAAIKVRNNVFVDTNKAWTFSYNPGTTGDTVRATAYGDASLDTLDTLVSDIADPETYFKAYPDFADWVKTNRNPRVHTEFDGNICVGPTEVSICEDAQKYSYFGYNPTDLTKDIFVDAANMDFRVRSDCETAQKIPGLLTEKNFDMDSIGLKSQYALSAETSPFRLMYPQNGSTVSTNGLQLYWQDAFLANEYVITIATDSEFSNVVVCENTKFNMYSPQNLEAGTKYYWKVTAHNTSRELAASWEHDGAVYSFTTGIYEPLDTQALESAITMAEGKLSKISEGTKPGTFKEGTKTFLTDYINKTRVLAALRLGKYSQQALDVRLGVIESYLDDKSLINKGYVDLLDYYDRSNWTDEIILQDAAITNKGYDPTNWNPAGSKTLSQLSGSVVYCFNMTVDFADDKESRWVSFGLSANPSTIQYVATNRGYYFVIKKGLIEFQKADGASASVLETRNLDVADGEKHSVEFGIVNTEIGCHIVLTIDSNVIFDYSDTTSTAPRDIGLEFVSMSRDTDSISFSGASLVPGSEVFEALQKKADFLAARSVLDTFPAENVMLVIPGISKVLGRDGMFDVSHAIPEKRGDYIMIPVGVAAKLFGGSVSEDGTTLTIRGKSAVFADGALTYSADGETITATQAPYNKNGHLMVSMADVATVAGCMYSEEWIAGIGAFLDSGAVNAQNERIQFDNALKIAQYLEKQYPDIKDIYYKDLK